ncbi:MAG TPA: hypothetical protein VFB79_18720 [Candidatus Angelobacter sp.]|nr:hypothetical protein [Candidatus Angelobacter sp.]
MTAQVKDSALNPAREIQGKEDVVSSTSYRVVQGPKSLCTAEQICRGFEVLTRVMLHLEHRAVEFVPRWRTVPGADADALMIIYGLRLDLTHKYACMRKAKRAHKAAA